MMRLSIIGCAFACATGLAHAAADPASGAGASVAQIVLANATARGGEARWHAVNTLTLSGQLDAGGRKATLLPFSVTMKRPHQSRFEVRFNEQTAYQVYDGAQGWKVRPFLNRNETEPYTVEETKSAAESAGIDSPLMDAAANGTRVALQGMEAVEGHNAYKLLLTLKDGTQRNLWVDATSYLELKMDGDPRKLDGRAHKVAIYFRDYRAEGGLTMAHVVETAVEGVKPSRKMTIEQVKVNPAVDDALFAKPALPVAHVASK
jgi:phage-related tail fiber protein